MTGVPYSAPRPPHACVEHSAGTRACYNRHHCRCRECADATTAYRKRLNMGMVKRVPTGAVMPHITRLAKTGMSFQDMERSGGVSETIYRDIATGRVRKINRTTAARIMATTPGGKIAVSSEGASRRIRALSVLGWTGPLLSAESGLDVARIRDLRRGKSATIPVADHATIDTLYGRLWSTLPPVSMTTRRMATMARQKGWPPPLAWDDGIGTNGIDNPLSTPAIGHVELQIPRGEPAREAARMLGTASANQIAKRLGYRSLDNLATTIARTDKHLASRLRAEKEVA